MLLWIHVRSGNNDGFDVNKTVDPLTRKDPNCVYSRKNTNFDITSQQHLISLQQQRRKVKGNYEEKY